MKIKQFINRDDAVQCLKEMARREPIWHYEIVQDETTMLYRIDCNIMKHVMEDGSIQ